jgi:hypothetical protein
MALRTPSPAVPAASAASGPPGHRAAPPGGRPARRLPASSTPTRLRLLMVALLLASLAWGALSAWTVIQHASAAQDVVSTSEPLSLSAQQMYRSLADADVTATTVFLSGPNEPLADRQRYTADYTQAATDLSNLKAGATSGSHPQLLASLSAISTALPVYTGYVQEAGSGTLLADAAASSPSGAGAQWVQAAEHDIQPWYAVNDQVYRLDSELHAQQERQLVTGTGPGSSAAGFTRVENDLSRAIAADQVIFHSNATAGGNAFAGLEAGIIVAALLMALGCVWGLDVRLAEYR